LLLQGAFLGAQASAGAYAFQAPESAEQGDPLFAWIESPLPLGEPSLSLLDKAGKKISAGRGFFLSSVAETALYQYGFLLPVPMDAPGGRGRLELAAQIPGRGETLSIAKDFEIKTKEFLQEDIPLDRNNSLIRTAPDPEKTAQALSFAALFNQRDLTALHFPGVLSRPLKGEWRQTSFFGDRRTYLYSGGGSDTSIHQGIDLGARTGTPVFACAPGTVAFADFRIVTGNTVVLEHLPGFFSIYMHLSTMSVAVGDTVTQDQQIGAVGSTGLSTGPHLHWELRIGNVPVNPHYWLARPVLDKDPVSGKIKPPAEGR
jgi:hypothetical protein